MSLEAMSLIPPNADVSIYEIMDRCALDEADERDLQKYVEARGCIFISTPFSRLAVERLDRMNIPAIKVGSGECDNIPLLRHIVELGRPIIMSTGMNSIDTIRPSVELMRSAGVPFALLHCTNIYPTPHGLVRLGAMQEVASAYPDAVIGLSDHTTDNYACLGAVALGASILERHFVDRSDRTGPDIACSMTPNDLSDLIRGSRCISAACGHGKRPLVEEGPTIAFASASVVAIRDICTGDRLSMENVWVMRPGGGDFDVSEFDSLLGRRALKDIPAGRQITRSSVASPDAQ
jgi:N-acetylneuraminate synthase